MEFEQNGADRAEYGERFIDALSERLKKHQVKGCSTTALRNSRTFYQYHQPIRQTQSGKSDNALEQMWIDIRQTLSGELAGMAGAPSAQSIPETVQPTGHPATYRTPNKKGVNEGVI